MDFVDMILLAADGLIHRGLRSWLAILGVVIGVAVVVAILSIGAGTQQVVSAQMGGLGADIITVSPGFSRAEGAGGPMGAGGAGGAGFGERFGGVSASSASSNLTVRDVEVIKSVDGVLAVNGIVSGRAHVLYLSQNVSVSVQGVDPLAWQQLNAPALDSGRYLTTSDGNAVVIGYRVANSMFKQPLVVNRQITLEGKPFTIVGILAEVGGYGSSDSTVLMPASAARTVVSDISANQLSSIQVKVTDAQAVDQVSSDITAKLLMSRHVTNRTQDFTVTSIQSTRQTISGVMSTLSLFLTGIAGVSLIVGAIGIANTMFTSVLERTRQIGILKAIGMTNSEIMRLFVTESAIMGLAGGALGVMLGFVASGIISEIGIRMVGTLAGGATMTVITPDLALFAIAFSVLIGIVSGILPARRASRLQPVEALRYE